MTSSSRLLALFASLACTGAATTARAQSAEPTPAPSPLAGQDVITIKGGGILRGTIIDALPGAPARIQLATGEIATVAAADILRIEHAGATIGPAKPAPPASPPPSSPQPSGHMVWVHLDASGDARLEQDSGEGGRWVSVCTAPCDQALPVSSDYRIGGGQMKASAAFKLSGRQGDRVTITASGGSTAWFVVGVVMTAISSPLTLTGLSIGLVGTLVANSNAQGTQGAAGVATVGWVLFGVGAAGLLGGVLLVVNNSKTTVDLSSPGSNADAWRWTPTWREASVESRSMPLFYDVPVLHGQF
jgi:hypothetical protein